MKTQVQSALSNPEDRDGVIVRLAGIDANILIDTAEAVGQNGEPQVCVIVRLEAPIPGTPSHTHQVGNTILAYLPGSAK